MSWYQALEKCREKSGELPTIETAAEANWMFDQIIEQSRRQKDDFSLYFYVNLHKWAYNSAGWAWSSGAKHDSSVIELSNNPAMTCADFSGAYCAYIRRTGSVNRTHLNLGNVFCDLQYLNATVLVCKRQRARCLRASSREITSKPLTSFSSLTMLSMTFSKEVRDTSLAQRTTEAGQSQNELLLWVLLLAGGCAIVAFLVLLFVALVVYYTLCRRQDDNTSTSPEGDSDIDSDSDSDTSSVSEAEGLTSAMPNSSGTKSWNPSGAKNNEKKYAPRLKIPMNPRLTRNSAVGPRHLYVMASPEQTDGSANDELSIPSAPTRSLLALHPLQMQPMYPIRVFVHSLYDSSSPANQQP